MTGKVGPDGILPNVALVGSFGSGKTGICNLVEQAYGEHKDLPKAAFCRFEAWQYCDPEAALGGLVGTLTSVLLARVDAADLWRLPNQYLAALSEIGGRWGGVLSAFLATNPASVLSRIGNVLQRTGLRMVVFIDDLDRIEETAPDAQRAITQALNQLQKVTLVQNKLGQKASGLGRMS